MNIFFSFRSPDRSITYFFTSEEEKVKMLAAGQSDTTSARLRKEFDDLKKEFSEIPRRPTSSSDELILERNEARLQLKKAQGQHATTVEEIKTKHDAAVTELKSKHDAAVAELKSKHDAAVAELKSKHEKDAAAAVAAPNTIEVKMLFDRKTTKPVINNFKRVSTEDKLPKNITQYGVVAASGLLDTRKAFQIVEAEKSYDKIQESLEIRKKRLEDWSEKMKDFIIKRVGLTKAFWFPQQVFGSGAMSEPKLEVTMPHTIDAGNVQTMLRGLVSYIGKMKSPPSLSLVSASGVPTGSSPRPPPPLPPRGGAPPLHPYRVVHAPLRPCRVVYSKEKEGLGHHH